MRGRPLHPLVVARLLLQRGSAGPRGLSWFVCPVHIDLSAVLWLLWLSLLLRLLPDAQAKWKLSSATGLAVTSVGLWLLELELDTERNSPNWDSTNHSLTRVLPARFARHQDTTAAASQPRKRLRSVCHFHFLDLSLTVLVAFSFPFLFLSALSAPSSRQ